MSTKRDTQWEIIRQETKAYLRGEGFEGTDMPCPACGDFVFQKVENADEDCQYIVEQCPSCEWSNDYYDC